MNLQEIITRGRDLFSGAPSRLDVFQEINGRRTAKDIASELGRSVNSVRNDLIKMVNYGLIQKKLNKNGQQVKRDGFLVFEKSPEVKNVAVSLFKSVGSRPTDGSHKQETTRRSGSARRGSSYKSLPIPSAPEIVDICHAGEDQLNEFKGPGADTKTITKEIAAMLHTRHGGRVFYGIADNGDIRGSDIGRQDFDQRLNGALRTNIDPPPKRVRFGTVKVMGNSIHVIIVPPWNKGEVHLFLGRAYIRRGTIATPATAAEVRQLHERKFID